MTVITVPSYIGFENCDISILRATVMLRSMLTGKRQVVASAFALWQFQGTIVSLQGVEAAAVRGFLASLRGRANTFRLPIPGVQAPQSAYSGTQGLVDTGGQLGNSIFTKSWTPSTLLLRKGDYFNLGEECKLSTEDVMSDGSGNAILTFEPPIRTSPANNSVVNYTAPYLYLSADDDEVAKWSLEDFNTHNIKLKAVEAFE